MINRIAIGLREVWGDVPCVDVGYFSDGEFVKLSVKSSHNSFAAAGTFLRREISGDLEIKDLSNCPLSNGRYSPLIPNNLIAFTDAYYAANHK